jgi:tetratricopeptide (TPR) repeat protein
VTAPKWNERLVEFRLRYVAEKLGQPVPSVEVTAPKTPVVAQPAAPAPGAQDVQRLNEEITQLRQERNVLEGKLREALSAQPATTDPRLLVKAEENIKKLEKDNDQLKQDLEKAKAAKIVTTGPEETKKALVEANQKVEKQNEAIKSLTEEKKALEAKLGAVKEGSKDAKKLESDNADLKDRLAKVTEELKSAKAKQSKDKTRIEIETLQAKLAAFEAQKVPYTAEEQALIKKSVPQVASVRAVETKEEVKPAKSSKTMSPAVASLVADAQKDFSAGRHAEAEKKYRQVLNADENNVYTLGNLAATQIEQGKMAEAEANLKKAIDLDPQDAYNLSLMGIMKFRQEKFEEAFGFLSRSAAINPNSAETQNYLGITLSQKGQSAAAETALRKAIVLSPSYASAHQNLAVVYAMQKPVYVELARYHYQKAISLGAQANPDLEKLLKQAEESQAGKK